MGAGPDVLAYDPSARRLYVAAESGVVSVLERVGRRLRLAGAGHLAEGAHVVAVDPSTGDGYCPVPSRPPVDQPCSTQPSNYYLGDLARPRC